VASFQEHIEQAKHNLAFLEQINKHSNSYWDWQVTVSFYIGVHLINSHIYQKSTFSYRSHEQVNQAINPFNISPSKLDEKSYLAYAKLQGLARRSRYLCNEEHSNKSQNAHFTYDKHFSRAIRNLDLLIDFMKSEYNVQLPKIQINCVELKRHQINNFVVV
jgi:hypothetical protein